MTEHVLIGEGGDEFELVLDADSRITDVVGPWPTDEGAEFELRGALPDHAPIDDVPEHVLAFAAERGRHVCMYDPVGCRTCFCDADGNMLYRRNMC